MPTSQVDIIDATAANGPHDTTQWLEQDGDRNCRMCVSDIAQDWQKAGVSIRFGGR